MKQLKDIKPITVNTQTLPGYKSYINDLNKAVRELQDQMEELQLSRKKGLDMIMRGEAPRVVESLVNMVQQNKSTEKPRYTIAELRGKLRGFCITKEHGGSTFWEMQVHDFLTWIESQEKREK